MEKEISKFDIYSNIRKKYISLCIGTIVLNLHNENVKPLNKTEIKYLTNFFSNICFNKKMASKGEWMSGSMYAINKKNNVDFMADYVGNKWTTYCNLNQKLNIFYIDSNDYGTKNPCVTLGDIVLEKITKNMYKELENLYK
jgi:hypothetical protein